MGRAVQAADIRAVEREAQQAYGGEIQDRIAFVVVDRTPDTEARFQVNTCREESGFTVIPLGHGLLRQALLENQASEILHEQVNLYLMVTNIGRQMPIDYTKKPLTKIYAETSGHPFLNRNLCSLIIKDRPRPLKVDVPAVAQVVETFIYQPDSYLEGLWDERLDEDGQALLRRLVAEGPLTRDALVAGLETPRPMNQRLGALTEHHLLRESVDGYQIGFELFRRWICYQELGMDFEADGNFLDIDRNEH